MDFVRLETDGPIATITFDRPKALNALNSQTLTEFGQAVAMVAADRNLRALILTGAGEKAFIAGADIAEMAEYAPNEALRFSRLGHTVMSELSQLPIPTIAAINGFALGGGFEMALSCDLLYAAEKAKVGFPETTLAVIPGFGGTQRLTRLIGKMRAMELVFTGTTIDAQAAKALGLVLDVVPGEKLMAHCKDVALKMVERGPLAIAQAKRVMETGADLPLAAGNVLEQQAFGLLFGTRDQKEGMAAFLAKRRPAYKGE